MRLEKSAKAQGGNHILSQALSLWDLVDRPMLIPQVWVDVRFCFLNELPGVAGAADPRAALGLSRPWSS